VNSPCRRLVPLLVLLATATACGERPCLDCDRLVVAAVGEPTNLFPPLVFETVGRDISDQIFERLAYLAPSAAPIDTAAYRPGLAVRWERRDSLTWRFHLRPGAQWQDSVPVTAADVGFSFDAFADPDIDAPGRSSVEALAVEVIDSVTVDIRFPSAGGEQLYDATYHVRILPRHVWRDIPKEEWGGGMVSRLVGSGPYRLVDWQRPSLVRLEAAPTYPEAPGIREVVWIFHSDPDAATNLLLSHEAQVIENVPPGRRDAVEQDSMFRLIPYPSAVYGFLAFHLTGSQGRRPHPILGDQRVRRALALATDRAQLARAVIGPETVVPDGPMSGLLWINSAAIQTLPVDTAAAAVALEKAGWRLQADGMRRRGGVPLGLDILVPATSRARQQLAEALQAAWRRLGVDVSITAVDFSVFNQRLAEGQFDSYIGAWIDEPSPRSLADQWTRAGWGALNYSHYASPAFDSAFARAVAERDPAEAKRLWAVALDTLNADAPAIFLFNPVNDAAVPRRLDHVTINPFSWMESLPQWRLVAGP